VIIHSDNHYAFIFPFFIPLRIAAIETGQRAQSITRATSSHHLATPTRRRAMAAPNPLSALPSSGTFPVNLAPSLLEAFDPPGKKRKRSDEELIGLRCEWHGYDTSSLRMSIPLSVRRRFQARFDNPLDSWLA
jgi:hypothetical protein